jgi:ABC-2 type transport system ATP-binding protein
LDKSNSPLDYEIWTENLTKVYGFGRNRLKAVDGINLKIKSGIHGFLGPNGAGKTTTINMLLGAISITEGKAKVRGAKVGSIKAKKDIGFLPQEPAYYEKMTGEKYLIFMGRMGGLSKKKAVKKTKELIVFFDLEEKRDKKIKTYSGGMKQKIGLAVALINEPKLLILDEPTSDLDPVGRQNIIDKIGELSEQMSIFISSHILSEVEQMCKEVTIINRGKIKLTDKVQNLKTYYKNLRNIYYLNTNNNKLIFNILNSKNCVENIWIEEKENCVKIIPRDLEKLQEVLPHILSENKLLIKSFYQEESSLQDIFIEMMKKEGNYTR